MLPQCGHGACHAPAKVSRLRTALSLRTFDRLDCAANAKDVLYIFATSGGVHALI